MRVTAVSPEVARLCELTGRNGQPSNIPISARSGIPGSGAALLQEALAGALPARRDGQVVTAVARMRSATPLNVEPSVFSTDAAVSDCPLGTSAKALVGITELLYLRRR
jgi:hypothetical protein